MIRRFEAPIARAASTNSRRRREITCPLTIRAMYGHVNSAMMADFNFSIGVCGPSSSGASGTGSSVAGDRRITLIFAETPPKS